MGVGRGELIVLLVRRHEMLRTMAKAPRTKDELSTALDLSRSTIDRSIRELETQYLVEPNPNGYMTTVAGQLALEEYDRLDSRLSNFDRFARALSVLPPDAPVDASLLANSEVTLADPTNPHQPIDAYAAVLERATHVRTMVPAVIPQLVDASHRRIVEEELTAQVVLSEAVLERLIAAYTERFQGALDTGRLSVRQTEELTYGLSIVEARMGLSVNVLTYTETGAHALIRSIDPAAIQWAEVVFGQGWQAAQPLPDPG